MQELNITYDTNGKPTLQSALSGEALARLYSPAQAHHFGAGVTQHHTSEHDKEYSFEAEVSEQQLAPEGLLCTCCDKQAHATMEITITKLWDSDGVTMPINSPVGFRIRRSLGHNAGWCIDCADSIADDIADNGGHFE